MNTKRLVWLGLGLVTVLVASILFLQWFFTASVDITTSSNKSQIFVRQGNKDFFQIGTGRATFKTRDLNSLYIELRDDQGAITQTSVTPVRRKTTSVSLKLNPLRSIKQVALGPFIYPLIEGDYIFGINPNTNSLDVKSLSSSDELGPQLPLLPFLKQVVWQDSKNYIYVTAGRGVGVISTNPSLLNQKLPFSSVVMPNDSTTALLGSEGLYIAPGLDLGSAQKIATYPENTDPFIFADSRYIFMGWLEFELAHEERKLGNMFNINPEHDEDDPGIKSVELLVFSHQGDQVHSIDLPIKEQVLRVVSVDKETFAVLSTDGLFVAKTNGESELVEFSFGRVNDLLVFEGRLLLLGDRGLWEYDKSTGSYHRLINYPSGELYTPNSLAVLGNKLYFSTLLSSGEISKDSSSARSRVYEVVL